MSGTETPWTNSLDKLPPNGLEVYTKIQDADGPRTEIILKRLDNLWFNQDGRTYVYYTPTHWRFTQQADADGVAMYESIRAQHGL